MARRKGKRSRRGKSKIPMTIAIPLIIHAMPTVKALVENKMDIAAYEGMAIGAGGRFDTNKAMMIATPYVAGIVAHKLIGKSVNRYVPKWMPVNF